VGAERSGGELVLSVADSGQGIGAGFLPHLFERFRQADSSTTRAHGGLGLGLAIVRHLVELHGGTVRADSAGAGEGTRVTVRLPLAAACSPEPPAPGALLDGVRVLVVDDELDARDLAGALLREQGAQVRCCASAVEALALLGELRPHALVSDIGMPGLDGYELVRRVRALPGGAAIRAVALTAYAEHEHRARALEAGFERHLPKPFEAGKLVEAIAELVKGAPSR
jgi:CheY-like chemotaxis protein